MTAPGFALPLVPVWAAPLGDGRPSLFRRACFRMALLRRLFIPPWLKVEQIWSQQAVYVTSSRSFNSSPVSR